MLDDSSSKKYYGITVTGPKFEIIGRLSTQESFSIS
jgi:hypothetical protein